MHLNHSKTRLLVLAAFALVTGLAGCASTGGSGGGSGGGTRRDPNRITAEELADYTTLSAVDVVRRLRPRWLQGRGGQNMPQLILDGARMGDAQSALRSLSVSDIQEMQYLNSSDATMRFGTNFPGGAIIVTSRSR